jgi:hypothetical protein
MRRTRSPILEAVHETATGLHKAGVMAQATLHEFDCLRKPIRADEKRKVQEQLEALLLEGLEGEETPMTRADWRAIRQETMAQAKARKRQR